MENTASAADKVRCVRIDPFMRSVREEFVPRQLLRRKTWRGALKFTHHGTVGSGAFKKGAPWLSLAYHQPDPRSRTGLFKKGFVFDTRDTNDPYRRQNMEQWELETSGIDAAGEGLLYAYDGIDRRAADPEADALGEPMDFPWTIDEVRRRIVIWTDGILRRLPDITVMLAARFDEPSQYELLLRVENEVELHTVYHWIYGEEMTQHVRHLTPQIVSLSIGRYDLQIVTGRVRVPSDKVRVSIYSVKDSRLPLVDSISVTANKAPQWIMKTMRRFFEKELVDKEVTRGKDHREWVDPETEGEAEAAQ